MNNRWIRSCIVVVVNSSSFCGGVPSQLPLLERNRDRSSEEVKGKGEGEGKSKWLFRGEI